MLTHLLLAPEECDLSKMPRPDQLGFGETRHALSGCIRRAHRKLGPLSTHPGNGAAGLVSTADDSRIIGLWGVNYMEEQWRRGDFLIHLAGTPRKRPFHAFARPLETSTFELGVPLGSLTQPGSHTLLFLHRAIPRAPLTPTGGEPETRKRSRDLLAPGPRPSLVLVQGKKKAGFHRHCRRTIGHRCHMLAVVRVA